MISTLYPSFSGCKISYDKDELSYYIGDWVDNKKCGRGFRQYPSGSTYEGEWFENLRHGQGTMRWAGTGECYTGQWNMGIQVLICHLLPDTI